MTGAAYDAQRNERCAYILPETETPFGHTLGNFKSFATATPKGGIRGLWDANTDRIIFGTHHVAYRLRDAERTFLPHQIERTFTFRPHAQISYFKLQDRLDVVETFYVPHGRRFDRSVAFVLEIALRNAGAQPVAASVMPWALLIGQRFYGEPEKDVRASVDGARIRAVNDETGAVRLWGASRRPHAALIALREHTIHVAMQSGDLREHAYLDEVTPPLAEYVSHRIFGALEYRIDVAPGATENLRVVVLFDGAGTEAASEAFEALLSDDAALADTEAYYATALADARFLVPSPAVSRGVVWAKTNMLRIVKEYPQGWGSTNSPPSDILVSRDTSWFVHGFDYFMPQFSRDAIDLFNRHLEESGQVVEYVRGVSGFKTSYDLNVNDDTPLHLIAILHHYNSTRDVAWVRSLHSLIVRIADYLLSQRDERGLVFCNAKGVDMYGIASWRNIIPLLQLDGAVTEINAECAYAFDAVATLCTVAGDAETGARYADEARRLREKMVTHLYNRDSGAFVLNYDKHGNYQDDFTADEVFPVLFEIVGPQERASILQRLLQTDFTTPVGLRTISTADAWYFPSHGFGLLGGIWPDLTLWFAVALARNGFARECAVQLGAVYAAMEAGAARNAVPGQFAEWFDGGSLTNRGMYLSPWTGAKYLWAVAETAGGLDGYRTADHLHLAPLVPPEWRWTAAVRVHAGGTSCTYVVDAVRKRIYGNVADLTAETPYRCFDAGRDVSDELEIFPVEVGGVAFEDPAGGVLLFLCNLEDAPREATVRFRAVRRVRSLAPGELAEMPLIGSPVAREIPAADATGAVA